MSENFLVDPGVDEDCHLCFGSGTIPARDSEDRRAVRQCPFCYPEKPNEALKSIWENYLSKRNGGAPEPSKEEIAAAAKAMEETRLKLIAQPIARLYPQLAEAALKAAMAVRKGNEG